MRCVGCGKEYNKEMFPVCPYCLLPNDTNEVAIPKLDLVEEAPENRESEDSNEQDSKESVQTSEENIDEISEISISELNFLSNRSRNALTYNGIYTIGDLRKCLSENKIISMPHVGKESAREILNIDQDVYIHLEDIKRKRREKLQSIDITSGNVMLNTIDSLSVRSKNALQAIGLKTVADLMEYLGKHDVMEIKNVGVGSAKEIINLADSIKGALNMSESIGAMQNVSQKTIDPLYPYINEELRNINIDILYGLGIKEKPINLLKQKNYNCIGDLANIDIFSLKIIIGKNNIEKFLQLKEMLTKNLVDIFENILENFSLERDYLITLQRAEGYTLEEIGQMEGLSRERVRQIVSKFNKKITPFMLAIVDSLTSNKEYVTVQELLDIYDNDDYDKILIYWAKFSGYLIYLDFADVFLPNIKDNSMVKDKIIAFLDEWVGNGIEFTDKWCEAEEFLQYNKMQYIHKDAIINLLQDNGYHINKNYVTNGRKSYGYLCARIVGKYFPNGIKLYDKESMDRLRTIALDEYGDIGISENDRALSARIDDFTVLCGRGTVTAEENIHVDMALMENIKEYIDNAQERELYYSELYAKFERMIKALSNIDNYNFLHGVIKLYYPNEYDYSQRDHLTKRGSGLKSGKFSLRLNEFIVGKGRPVHKNEIKQEFGCSDVVIMNAVASDEKLMQWDYNYYYSMDLISVSENDRAKIVDYIRNTMDKFNGYCSDMLLLDTVRKNYGDFLVVNHIENNNNIFFLCAKLLSNDFDFRRPHIVQKNTMDKISIQNVALKLLGNYEEIDYREYQSIAKMLKWSDSTTSLVFLDIELEYIRISEYIYRKTELFHISDELINSIEMVLREKMQNGYLTLMNFDDWDALPEIEYPWNVFLLHAIINHFIPELKIIESRFKDRRFERGIVVEKNSTLNSYEDVVVNFMKRNGLHEVRENKMLSLLVNNNLVYKIIPQELYNGSKLKYENEKFSIIEKM